MPSHIRASLQFQKNNNFEKDIKRRNKNSLIHRSIDEMEKSGIDLNSIKKKYGGAAASERGKINDI